MNRLLTGALAGVIAAVPMTVTMEALHRSFPTERHRPLPPERITMTITEGIGVRRYLDEERKRIGVTLIAHFGYAATTGALYAALMPQKQQNFSRKSDWTPTPALTGALYGVGVWTVSYLGWIPATGLLTSATKHKAQRNLLMIASHIVWGAALGLAYQRLHRKSST